MKFNQIHDTFRFDQSFEADVDKTLAFRSGSFPVELNHGFGRGRDDADVEEGSKRQVEFHFNFLTGYYGGEKRRLKTSKMIQK